MMMQLLQQGGFNPPPGGANPANNPAFAAGFVGGFVCVLLVFLIVLYGPYIFMLIKAMQALQAVRPRNRSMAPGLVWIALIPFVNVVMNFFIVLKTSEALENEFDDRRLSSRGDHGKQLGMIYAVLVVLNFALSGLSQGLQLANGANNAAGGFGPLAATILGLGCFNCVLVIAQIVLPIVYGLKLAKSTARLLRDDERYGDDDRDDDYDDDPKPRKKPKKPVDDDFEEYDDEPKPKPKKKPKLDDDFEEYDEPKGGR